MSGATALAAARRRRAQPSGDDLPRNKTNTPDNRPVTSAPTPTTPIQVLIKHENKLNTLMDEVEMLKDNAKQTSPTNPNDIEYFKNQYTQIVHEVSELKKLIMKVQSFSMENNMEIIQLKKAVRQEKEIVDILEETDVDLKEHS